MASASASDPADAGEARNPAEATAMAEAPAVTGAADTPEVTGETDAVEARRLSVKLAAQALAPLAEILSRKKVTIDTEYHANAVLDLKAGEEHVIYFGDQDELENRARTFNQTRPGRHGTSYDVCLEVIKGGFIGGHPDDREPSVTHKVEDVVNIGSDYKDGSNKCWSYANRPPPDLGRTLPPFMCALECRAPWHDTHVRGDHETAWLPEQVLPIGLVLRARLDPPLLDLAQLRELAGDAAPAVTGEAGNPAEPSAATGGAGDLAALPTPNDRAADGRGMARARSLTTTSATKTKTKATATTTRRRAATRQAMLKRKIFLNHP